MAYRAFSAGSGSGPQSASWLQSAHMRHPRRASNRRRDYQTADPVSWLQSAHMCHPRQASNRRRDYQTADPASWLQSAHMRHPRQASNRRSEALLVRPALRCAEFADLQPRCRICGAEFTGLQTDSRLKLTGAQGSNRKRRLRRLRVLASWPASSRFSEFEEKPAWMVSSQHGMAIFDRKESHCLLSESDRHIIESNVRRRCLK